MPYHPTRRENNNLSRHFPNEYPLRQSRVKAFVPLVLEGSF